MDRDGYNIMKAVFKLFWRDVSFPFKDILKMFVYEFMRMGL